MASSAKVATILLLVCMLVAQPFATQAAINCGTVAQAMKPCVPYLQTTGGKVSKPCCAGVNSLASAAKTTQDRRTACTCLKSAASSIKGINLSNAAGLPKACGVTVPYAISPNTNCATVK